jgi:hypothetical protein
MAARSCRSLVMDLAVGCWPIAWSSICAIVSVLQSIETVYSARAMASLKVCFEITSLAECKR